MALSLGKSMANWINCKMELVDIMQLLDTGMTGGFAILVYLELRKMREDIVKTLHELEGFIKAKSP